MDDPRPNLAEDEVERLREALDAETRRCLDLERRLGHASGEFEEFVSTAAHNLRESLRNVAAFGRLIAENQAGRLDSESKEYLDRIQEGAAAMTSLLSDMVDYCAAGVGGEPASRTDMEAVLRQALLDTDKPIEERGAIVTHDPLPAVEGDFELLAKVLRHLIRNAIEYCETSPPRVHISSARAALDWRFSVQDNGPGIEAAFQERIFGVFKRLHGRGHPGNGIGLALCRKAIEWHGGRIWVEPAPGAGSIFYFTLPASD